MGEGVLFNNGASFGVVLYVGEQRTLVQLEAGRTPAFLVTNAVAEAAVARARRFLSGECAEPLGRCR